MTPRDVAGLRPTGRHCARGHPLTLVADAQQRNQYEGECGEGSRHQDERGQLLMEQMIEQVRSDDVAQAVARLMSDIITAKLNPSVRRGQ